jgi:GAF domain-containing protein
MLTWSLTAEPRPLRIQGVVMPPSEDARLLAAVMAEVQSDPAEGLTVEAVIGHAKDVVPDADHVSITIRRKHGRFATLASTSQKAELLDRLQYELEEGPCIEALEDADWFRSGDIERDPRWPRWGRRAGLAGGGSLCSIPLLARNERVGALNLYADRRGAFDEREVVEMASLYAVHVAYALSSARKLAGLEVAMASRHTIGLAQGMLIERFGLDANRAFALLCRISSTQNRRVLEIARELTETGAIAGTDIGGRAVPRSPWPGRAAE